MSSLQKIRIDIKASSRYPIRRKKIRQKIEDVLEAVALGRSCEVEVNVVGDRAMRQLKMKHFKIDETTDVLSFPLHENLLKKESKFGSQNLAENKQSRPEFVDFADGYLRLGTIFISYPQAQRQANTHKLLIDEEIDQLVEHGMWHLLGVHHE